MPKKPSDATQLRTVRRNLADVNGRLALANASVEQWRGRATKAEQEVAEWKRRFDDLLRLRPGVQAVLVPPPLEERIKAMVNGQHETSQYIDAIKLVREETHMGLKEAKDYVDSLRTRMAA